MSLYEKLRKRYHSKSGMYINKKTCTDLDNYITEMITKELVDIERGMWESDNIDYLYAVREKRKSLKGIKDETNT